MSIKFQVLGEPGHDNALFVRVETGQTVHRLLFDCGEQCVSGLPVAEAQAIEHLCFSHLHMDHVAGFDALFRVIFNRPTRPVQVWGPPETSRILHHRFQGFLWNLYADQPGTWYVTDIHADHRASFRFAANEAFALAHPAGVEPFADRLIETATFTLHALHLDHRAPSMAYILRERPRLNVDPLKLAKSGLQPGPWLQMIRETRVDEAPTVTIGDRVVERRALREQLLVETPGESIAYLTDFLLDEPAQERLLPILKSCTTLVCESQYREADLALALRNHHMTAAQAARLADRADVGQLLLFHLSQRYRREEWPALLAEARAIFPNTQFPSHWDLGDGR